MKKLLSIAIIFIILTAVLCGCSNKTPSTDTDIGTTSTPAESEKIDVSNFIEVETSSESSIDIYRAEVLKRLKAIEEDEDLLFITDEEWEIISNYGDLSDDLRRHNASITEFSIFEEKSEYFYPVLFREGNALIMWYTSPNGSVLLERVYGYWNSSNYVGKIHSDSEEEEWLSSNENVVLTYAQESGNVKLWQFGDVQETFTGIPAGSVYCGFSRFEGYIFRSGTDIYSLNAVGTWNADGSVECIAHNVEYVIDADYNYGSDPWCQPLFLMTDGSIKCYIGWEGDQDTPDSPSHLVDLKYEGSYDK